MYKKNLPNAKRPLLFGHRGVSSLAPENTIASFKKAVELGIPGVELDVHLTKTGELAVIHDSSIKRTGRIYENGKIIEAPDLKVEDLSWEELQKYDFGIWFSKEYEGEKLPLLYDVLKLLGSDIYVDIEIKIDNLKYKGVVEKTYQVLKDILKVLPENPHRFLVSSFNPFAIRYFSKICSDIPTALIYDNHPDNLFFLKKGRGLLFCRPDILKPSYKCFKKKKDKESWCWTVDDKEKAMVLIKKGVTGIISNRPQDLNQD